LPIFNNLKAVCYVSQLFQGDYIFFTLQLDLPAGPFQNPLYFPILLKFAFYIIKAAILFLLLQTYSALGKNYLLTAGIKEGNIIMIMRIVINKEHV